MVKVWAAVKDGWVVLRTRTVAEKVPVVVGVQENAPVVGSIEAPAGAPASRLNASGLAGTLGSAAWAVKVRVWPWVTVLFPMGDKTGGTPMTVTVGLVPVTVPAAVSVAVTVWAPGVLNV